MVKAIDNIKAWAKENVQLITILPENTILKVDTRLKDVLEASVDEKYYLSDEKTALLVSQLENGLAVKEATKQGYALAVEGDAVNFQFPKSQTRRGRVEKQMANTLEASGVNQGVVELQQYSDGEGISYNIDANYAKGTSVGDIGKGRRTHVLEKKPEMLEQLHEIMKTARPNQEIQYTFKENGDIRPHRMDAKKSGVSELNINYEENPSHTVTTTHAPKVYGETTRWRIRKLTPLECFRLQSFPDWAYHEATEVNSNSQLYKQAGNSVTVNVIYEIAKRLN